MESAHDLTISNLALTLVPEPGDMPFRPVVHTGEARLSNIAFVKIVRRALSEEIATPYATLTLRSCRLIDGGAEVVLRVRKSFIDSELTTRVAFSPAGNGDLRATVTHMRLGILAASKFLNLLLDSVNKYPGLRKSGPQSIDINLSTVLQSRKIPVHLDAGVERVEATEHMLTMMLA